MKGKSVLLINPWIYDFAAYDLWAKPLGLLSIGAVLQANGCRISYIDCLKAPHPSMQGKTPKERPYGDGKYYREVVPTPQQISDIPRRFARYGISEEAFLQDLSGVPEPDAILVTSLMTYWYPGVFEAIRLARIVHPDAPVLLGGIYATLCRDHALRLSGADHVVSHEGEIRTVELLAGLWGATPEFMPERDDLDSLPYPILDRGGPLRYACVQTSRGCPYRCTYCASPVLNAGLRRRDPLRVADEISHWVAGHGVRDIAFYDDALLHQPGRHALPLMREVEKRGLDVRFHCPNALHARCIDRETAAAMKGCGFTTVRLGLETSDPARQRETGAKVSNDDFLHAVDSLCLAGFDPSGIGVYILCGLPGQQAREVFDAIEFVKSAGARPMIAEYSPLPGTREWDRACRSSRYALAEDPLFHNNTLLPCAWEGLTMEMYLEMKREAQTDPDAGSSHREGLSAQTPPLTPFP